MPRWIAYPPGAGDVDGDGYGDLVVGVSHASPDGRGQAGVVALYYGTTAGITTTTARFFGGEAAGDNFGVSVF